MDRRAAVPRARGRRGVQRRDHALRDGDRGARRADGARRRRCRRAPDDPLTAAALRRANLPGSVASVVVRLSRGRRPRWIVGVRCRARRRARDAARRRALAGRARRAESRDRGRGAAASPAAIRTTTPRRTAARCCSASPTASAWSRSRFPERPPSDSFGAACCSTRASRGSRATPSPRCAMRTSPATRARSRRWRA